MQRLVDQRLSDLSMMRLTINGERREFESEITLLRLFELLELQPARLAVELNREIVRRTQWPSTTLKEGDQLEIVQLVGGGSERTGKKKEIV